MAMRAENSARGAAHRFDVAALRELAGAKAFARGVEYHKGGQVEIVSIDHSRVRARVIGSEIYRAELAGSGNAISGSCSCPAFSDWGFCKHLVGTALAVNDLGPDAAEQAVNRLARIRDCLRSKGIEPLVAMIVELAENDPGLFRRLELQTAVATAEDDVVYAQFKKSIGEATRTNSYVDYLDAGAWAESLERVVDGLADLVAGGRAELALRLLDYFFARMDQALGNVDDSDGEGGAVYERACEIHLAACRAAKPEPVALVRDLFAREMESGWHFFDGASEIYADILGEAGLAEYRRLATQAWRKIKPLRPGARRADDEERGDRYRLSAILEGFAERDGDLDAQIAIRSHDLSTAYHYLGIAQLCLDNGRAADAAKWAEEGLWQFEDDPDQRLVLFTVDLYGRAGRENDAVELLWRSFERTPSIELYRRLKKAQGRGEAAADAVRERAIACLRAKLGRPAKATRSPPHALLLDILLSENLLADAWELVRAHGANGARRLALAEASEQSHSDEALSTYAEEAERLAQLGGQDNYAAAVRLIERMQAIRKRLGRNADLAVFLADFMRRHRAKRNLMKCLQASMIATSLRSPDAAAAR